MFGVTDLDPLVTQIDTDKVAVQLVEHGLKMNPLEDDEIAANTPAVYVYSPGADASEYAEGDNACNQSMRETIFVEYICKLSELPAVTLEVRQIVTRFNLGQYHGTTAFAFPPRVGGSTSELLGQEGDFVHWRDKFEVELTHRVGVNA